MPTLVWGMIVAAVITPAAGLLIAWQRLAKASGLTERVLLLGPIAEATALAMFAAEHFFAARLLAGIVPHWLPGPVFWTYFVGFALFAAALSLIAGRCVRWSASLLALLFLIIVATIDLPNLSQGLHSRLFWILTVRETAFAGGAMVLAGSARSTSSSAGRILITLGRAIVACTFVFYAVEHFLYPLHVPGVPLEKHTPAWVPAPALLGYAVGAVLLAAGIGLMIPRTRRKAAAGAGAVLLLLTLFFYLPIFAMEIHTPLAVEGLNYIGDTMLFAGTALLAGLGSGDGTLPSQTP